MAAALGLSTSPSSLLRSVRRLPLPAAGTPRAVGIDDWAWRKGMVYGTIVVDLEAQRVVDLLPDREIDTVAAWLRAHPEIEVISRDRSEQYAEAAHRRAPQARQWRIAFNSSRMAASFGVVRGAAKRASRRRHSGRRFKQAVSAAPC